MKMSPGGKVLASAGDDKNINIWVLKSLWNTFVEKYYLKVKIIEHLAISIELLDLDHSL